MLGTQTVTKKMSVGSYFQLMKRLRLRQTLKIFYNDKVALEPTDNDASHNCEAYSSK